MARRITVRRLVPVESSYKMPRSAKRLGSGDEIIGDGKMKLVTMSVDADDWTDFQQRNPDGLGFPNFSGAGPLDIP